MDADRELLHHIVPKIDCAVLIVVLLDLQSPDPDAVLDSVWDVPLRKMA
jgi:hypothetical protein